MRFHYKTEQAKRLRLMGWVPFCSLNGQRIWVGPSGELETQEAALRLTL